MLLTLLLLASVAMNYLHYSQERQERKEKKIKLKMRSMDIGSNQKKGRLLGDKLLIVIGLALTIPIVLLESLLPHSPLTGFMTLALASPTQLLLGRPFYYRFFRTVKYRTRFTTDTLVVLSTM